MIRHLVSGVDRRERSRQVTVARHRERRPAYARNQREERPQARDRRADPHDRERPDGACPAGRGCKRT